MGYTHVHNLFGSTFMGVRVLQYWADIALWELFLTEHPHINAIIEIGTHKAGMALFFLGHAIQRGMPFWTFDKVRFPEMDSPLAKRLGLEDHFVQGNVFENSNERLLKLLHDDYLKPLMLYVDGGNKPKEFQTFVPHLSIDDYCSVHDYSTEFKPEAVDPVADMLEPVFLPQCQCMRPCLTRFWRVIKKGENAP